MIKRNISEADDICKKLGMIGSYCAVLEAGHKLIKNSENYKFSDDDYRLLLGNNTKGKTYPLLGRLTRAVKANEIIRKKNEVTETIMAALRKAMAAKTNEEFLDSGLKAFNLMLQYPGIGIAVASRLLTLACPDRAISVNGPSINKLNQWSRLRLNNENIHKYKVKTKYQKLLEYMFKQPWYQCDEPHGDKDDLETQKTVWRYRAALIDILVYENKKKEED